MTNLWQSVITADLKDAEYVPQAPIPEGAYNATVTNVEAKSFKTGAKGVMVTYTIQDEGEYKGRELRDYLIQQTADGQTNKQGTATILKLLVEGGITLKDIKAFKFPDHDSKAFGDFKKLLDQPYTITVKNQLQKKGPQAGKTFARIATFTRGA